jgi:primosomal protein N' (replication factor Y)
VTAVADRFAEVAVQRPVPGRYHYRVPAHLAARVQVGARVLVLFGTAKVTGVVTSADAGAPPEGVAPVELSDVLDGDEPSLTPELVELCLWIADYYEAPPGEVMRAALPGGTSVAAHEVFAVTDAGRAASGGDGGALPSKQREALAALVAAPVPAAGMSAALRRHVDALAARGYVARQEQRDAARVRLPRERVVEVAPGVDAAAARAALGRAPKRLAVLNALAAAGEPVVVAELARAVHGAAAAVRVLERAGTVVTSEREVALGAFAVDEVMQGAGPAAPPVLTAEQGVAVGEIVAAMEAAAFTPFLLHGVTGSGKTEVYLRVIAETLARGRTALVLVPEISLTPQLAARFRARFGDRVAILHSGMSEPQRLAEWSRLRRGDATIAVGARSAVFAPLARLGVIVVDEEHDGSFKQDEGVKYHGRDVALVRAQRAGAVCVLGSATPSLESYAHAERGAYRRLALTERPTARPMPKVEIVDLRTYLPDGEAFLSSPLRTALVETLAAGDQAILFLNRRGFATFVLCRACGHAFRCPDCSVSLTYHRYSDGLSCHYCGHFERVPDVCPGTGCGRTGTIERKGLGTERVAEAIAAELAGVARGTRGTGLIGSDLGARVARLDRDVATGPRIEAVLAKVARREVDVLVGTQMVTKGHDFPGVTLVGVLCADTGLNLPDFRASERTFQLLAQVAGRAGRGDRPGRVIVQTYRPTAPAVVAAAAHDYAQFFAAESAERATLGYPPHGRLIAVRIDGAHAGEVQRTAERLAELADRIARRPENAGVEVRGPVAAPLEKIRKRTRWQIWLRAADRHALRRVARGTLAADVASNLRVGLDVDPMSAM